MRKEIAQRVLNFCLENLARQGALCFYQAPDGLRIPYLMNDTVECYLLLRDARVTGCFEKFPGMGAAANGIYEDGKRAVIVRQKNGSVFTVWYEKAPVFAADCYQYHQIMHYRGKGSPHLKRQAAIVSAICDKRRYIGSFVCNDTERELCDLIGFTPFRHYAQGIPAETLTYQDEKTGAEAMRKLALEAGDRAYVRMIDRYMKEPSGFLCRLLTVMLAMPGHEKIYEKLEEKIETASSGYSGRSYDKPQELSCAIRRITAGRVLENRGFTGTYPHFRKGLTSITVYEEQPFTKMEDRPDDFNVFLLKEQKHMFFIKRTINRIVYPKKVEELAEFVTKESLE